MTVEYSSNSKTFLANGVQVDWQVEFMVLEKSDLSVRVTDPAGVESSIPQGSFDAAGFGAENACVVTYPITGSPLAAGYQITVSRAVPIEQPTALANAGPFLPRAVESAFDRLTLAMQDAVLAVGAGTTVTPAFIENYTELKALTPLQAVAFGSVIVLVREQQYDEGGGIFTWGSGDFTAEVTSDPYQGLFVTANADPTGANGVWMRQTNNTIYAEWFGVKFDDTSDNSGPLQAAINFAALPDFDACRMAAHELPARFTTALTVPSFTVAGNAWDQLNPFKMIGGGQEKTILHYTGTAGKYAIAYASIETTSNRGQNAPCEFAHFKLVGPGDSTKPVNGIGIDNVTAPEIHHMGFEGFPGNWSETDSFAVGGFAIVIRGYAKGGSYGGRIYNNRFGSSIFSLISGNPTAIHTKEQLAQYMVRSAVWFNGSYLVAGKVNDIVFHDNRVENYLMYGIYSRGFDVASWDGSGNGSSINNTSRNNVYFAEASRRFEVGGIYGVTSQTVMRIGQTNYQYNTNGDYNGFYLAVTDNQGVEWAQYITGFTGATRTVTLAGNLGFTPVFLQGTIVSATSNTAVLPVGASGVDDYYNQGYIRIIAGTGAGNDYRIADYVGATRTVTLLNATWTIDNTSVFELGSYYRVGFADAESRANLTNPLASQPYYFWEQGAPSVSAFDYAERTSSVVAGVKAGYDFIIVMPNDVVNNEGYPQRVDGTFWAPRAHDSGVLRGSKMTPAHGIRGSLIMGDPAALTNGAPILEWYVNQTGGNITTGDCVRLVTTDVTGAQNSSPAVANIHILPALAGVTANNLKVWANGQTLTAAMAGTRQLAKVRVPAGQSMAHGDYIIPDSGNQWTFVASAAATLDQYKQAIGRALAAVNNSGGGSDLISYVKVRLAK